MMFIKHDVDKEFIMPLKANRKATLSEQAKRDGPWVRKATKLYVAALQTVYLILRLFQPIQLPA